MDRTLRGSADHAMAVLEDICRFDRFQVGHGIDAAADTLAGHARKFAPEVRHYAVTGGGAWWDVAKPHPEAPVQARMNIPGFGAIDMAETPMMIASGSLATAPDGEVLKLRLFDTSRRVEDGALYLVPGDLYEPTVLVANGVRYLATDVATRTATADSQVRGRLELDPASGMTGFSVTSAELDSLRHLDGSDAHILVRTQKFQMPVVQWSLPGAAPGEVWLMAHLCHRAPGANDNSSGVAGLVLAAEHLANMHRPEIDRTIRFISGPEFTGAAALLQDLMSMPGSHGPSSVIALDMIGLERGPRDGPFCIERSPSRPAHPIDALAEHTLKRVFAGTGLSFETIPFHGYSDNALFSAGAFAAPTVQFCDTYDFCNHTDGDAIARIDPCKIAAVARAAADLSIWLARPSLASAALEVARTWRKRERTRLVRVAGSWPEPWATRFLSSSLARLEAPSFGHMSLPTRSSAQPGPMNLRGHLGRCTHATRARYAKALARDKGVLAALMSATIRRIDGQAPDAAVDLASYDLERPFGDKTRTLLRTILSETLPGPDRPDQRFRE